MIKFLNRYSCLVLVFGLFLAENAFATNGYFTHGTGTKNKAMAGGGIALPEDAIDVVNNPAVVTEVGNQLVFGAALFSPVRKYSTTESQYNGQGGTFTIGPNRIDSGSEYFVIPHIAKSWQLENNSAWSLAFYGRGGMNTEWDGGTATFDPDGPGPAPVMTLPGTYGGGDTYMNFSQAFFDITWAKKLDNGISLGVAAVLAAQMFELEGVSTFAGFTRSFAASGGTQMPTALSNNGTDWAYGAGLKLGMHAPLSGRVSLGLMYQSEIWMTEFDDYADLFAEQGDMDIPANFKAGLSFQASDNVAVNFDIEHTWYSDVESVGNPIQNIFGCPTAGQGGTALENCLGGENGAGFGWDDMTTFKLGMRYVAGEDWTWRLGYSYGSQPIDNDQMTFNILAPGIMEQHITAGFTLERTKGRQFNMAFMFAPSYDVTGPQNFDPSQNVTFEMYEWEIEASYSLRY
jgi:long-chain fatty acid transport protein